MFQGVFDDGLQEHAGNECFERVFHDLLMNLKIVSAESRDLDVEVVIDKIKFLLQRHKRFMLAQQAAQNIAQLDDDAASRVWIVSNQRRNGIERIEQKMRIDLR